MMAVNVTAWPGTAGLADEVSVVMVFAGVTVTGSAARPLVTELLLLSRLKVTVPVGLYPPVTVAVSAMAVPTTAVVCTWVVVIDGVAGVMLTGSALAVLVTGLLLLSPL